MLQNCIWRLLSYFNSSHNLIRFLRYVRTYVLYLCIWSFCHIISIPAVRIYLRIYVRILNLSSYLQFNTYSTYVLYIYVLYINTKKHFEIIKNNIKKKYKNTIPFHSQLQMLVFSQYNNIFYFNPSSVIFRTCLYNTPVLYCNRKQTHIL